jgi:hypothetical protein
LIAKSEIERIFGDEAIKELAQIALGARKAKAPAKADLTRFAASVRIAVGIFVGANSRLATAQVRAKIRRLYHLVAKAEKGGAQAAQALAVSLKGMPIEVRQALECCNPRGCDLPDAAEILSLNPAIRRAAVDRVRSTLSYGGSMREGRNRPSGVRSRSFEPLLKAPQEFRSRLDPEQNEEQAQAGDTLLKEGAHRCSRFIWMMSAADSAHREWQAAYDVGDDAAAMDADRRIAAAEAAAVRIERSAENRPGRPENRRGRPTNSAQREFVDWLAVAYAEMDRSVPATASRASPSPFSAFVRECFKLAKVADGNVIRLINERGRKRKEKQREMATRVPPPDGRFS